MDYSTNWGAVLTVAGVIITAWIQWLITRRASKSSDRHQNFEEASEIIERLNTEITRKDARISELEKTIQYWQERCSTCELKAKR